MVEPEREVEKELERDSNEAFGSPTSYEMSSMLSSPSPMDLSLDDFFSLDAGFPVDISSANYSPSRVDPFLDLHQTHIPKSPQPGYFNGIASVGIDDGNASSSTQPMDLSFDNPSFNSDSFSPRNSPSPSRVAPSPEPGLSQLISSDRELKFPNLWNLSTLRIYNYDAMMIEVSSDIGCLRNLRLLYLRNCSRLRYHDCHVQGKLASPGFAPSRNIIVTKIRGGIHSAVSHPENEGNRKTSKRKITLEDLQHFAGNRMDAANFLGVSESTIKRHCKRLGITSWRYRNRDKDNQSLTKPKDMIQMAGGSISCARELNPEHIDFPPEPEKGSDRSQIGVGLMEESSTHMKITPTGDMFASSTHEQCIEAGDPLELPVQPSELSLSTACLTPGKLLTATEAFIAEQVPDSSWTNLSCSDLAPNLAKATAAHMMSLVTETQDTRTVTMKANYREDTIRFQLSLTSGIIELRKEVAERLMLGVGAFSIKYLDDEDEWILMTGDKDLQECFNISTSLRRNVIRLLIHDIRF